MPAKPAAMLRLMTITVRALSTARMGMAWMGQLAGGGAGGGIGDIVGADDESDVGLRHVAVDVVHFEQPVIGDVGFGEQHVHVAGHASGDGMNAEADVDTSFGERVCYAAPLGLGVGVGW